MNRTEKFKKVILDNSISKDFEEAKEEWRMDSIIYDPDHKGECICGQKHIANIILIRNKHSNLTLRIGNNCYADTLGGCTYIDRFNLLRGRYKIQLTLDKYKLKFPDCHDKIDKWYKDNGINDWEKNFMHDMLETYKFSTRQLSCIVNILKKVQ